MPVLEGVKIHNPEPGVAVAELLGEHDLLTRDDLQAQLDALIIDNELVVIDLSQTTFIDSSVIHILTNTLKSGHESGTTLRLQMGTAPIVELCLEISGIPDIFEVAYNGEEALA